MKEISNFDKQHELNEALRNCLERMGIKIKENTNLDIGLESDYFELLDKFNQHLKMVVKINEGKK